MGDLTQRTGITIVMIDCDDPEQRECEHDFDIILEGVAAYRIFHNLNDIGKLEKYNGKWRWIEGDLSQQYADEIGKAITGLDVMEEHKEI